MITLRKIKNSDGTTSLMLDYRHNGKRFREHLKHLKLVKPTTPLDREENKQKLQTADAIIAKKSIQLQSEDYEIITEQKKGIDFLKFFKDFLDNYNKKDKRVVNACYEKFKDFLKTEGIASLTTKKVNEGLANDFKEYLESTLNGESPHNYFSKFKKLLKHGVRTNTFTKNPAGDLTIKRNESTIEKDVLSFEEIQKLSSTHCGNSEVKRAFLLSCLTGLRWVDINALQWKHIQGSQLKIKQAKTDIMVNVNLNKDAMELLGDTGEREEYVFSLPSHTAANKNLKNWCKRAEIEKHLTYHCGRHSFGTNLILFGSDVNTVSKLLGHSSLDFTQRYLREANALKEKAVDSLPSIHFNLTKVS